MFLKSYETFLFHWEIEPGSYLNMSLVVVVFIVRHMANIFQSNMLGVLVRGYSSSSH
jgi:hypothetical protein